VGFSIGGRERGFYSVEFLGAKITNERMKRSTREASRTRKGEEI